MCIIPGSFCACWVSAADLDAQTVAHLYLITGKLNRQPIKSSPASALAAQNRLNRKNQARQVQAQKRQALVSATRIFNGADGAPRIVAIVPLTPDVDSRSVATSFAESLDAQTYDCPESGVWRLRCVGIRPARDVHWLTGTRMVAS